MRCTTAVSWLLFCPWLFAQGVLHDPTRPALWMAAPPTTGTPATPLGNTQAEPDVRVDVLVLGKDRQLAVINGVMVTPGERLNDWRIVSLTERGVALRRDAQTQLKPLTPAVVKTWRPPANHRDAPDWPASTPRRTP